MSIKKAIKDKIEAVAEVAAVSMKVYNQQAPQRRAYPYAVFERVGPNTYWYDLGAKQDVYREIFEINIYHTDDSAMDWAVVCPYHPHPACQTDIPRYSACTAYSAA